MDTYIHSMPKTIYELHQQELVGLSTYYQGAYEPHIQGEYQPDWNYAPGNQYGNGERLHSSNMEFAYRSNSVAIPQDQFYAIQQQQPQHQSFNPYHQQQSLLSHQHHYKGYQQVQETHPPTGFVTQQPQMTNEPDFEIRDMLQQIIRDQENSVLENKKLLAEIKNTLETQGNKIRSMDITKHSEWTDDKEAECIPPQETVMEKALPNDTHLPFKKRYAAFTEDSDIQDGRGQNQTLQEFQAEKYAPETTLEQLTRSSDRVKSQISEKVHLTHSLDLLTESCSLLSNHQSFLNPNILLSDPDDEAKKKAVQAIWKTLLIELEALLEVEDFVQECYLPFECIVDENPVLRHEAKVEPLTTVSYSTKSNGERVCMGGKAFEDPCEGFIVVECILDKHLGVTSTNDLSTDEPKKVLFEKIRMKEFRGWFYDEYDPGDTWFYL